MEGAKYGGAAVIPHNGVETQHGIHDVIDKVLTPHLIGQAATAMAVLVARLDRLRLGATVIRQSGRKQQKQRSGCQLDIPAEQHQQELNDTADWQSEQRACDERLTAGSKFAMGKMV